MARRMTDRTREALALYDAIRPCFSTQTERARAVGLSLTAIKQWDRAKITRANESSLQRLRLVARACEQLQETMPPRAVGEYLLGSCFVDRIVPRLELVINSDNPEIVTELVRAESEAVASVVVKHLPPEAFDPKTWQHIVDDLPEWDREFYDDLKRRAKGRAPIASL